MLIDLSADYCRHLTGHHLTFSESFILIFLMSLSGLLADKTQFFSPLSGKPFLSSLPCTTLSTALFYPDIGFILFLYARSLRPSFFQGARPLFCTNAFAWRNCLAAPESFRSSR